MINIAYANSAGGLGIGGTELLIMLGIIGAILVGLVYTVKYLIRFIRGIDG